MKARRSGHGKGHYFALSDRASSKEQVLGTATKLAGVVRKALGDETSESAQRFATQTFSATSLEVVREYAAAAEALSSSKYEAALRRFANAVALDPKFGLGYAGMAIASRNMDKHQDAEKYIKEAVSHLDGMTERERYRTRGLFYFITKDYQACVKEYSALIDRYAADAAARNNLALCLTYLRQLPKALDEMRQVDQDSAEARRCTARTSRSTLPTAAISRQPKTKRAGCSSRVCLACWRWRSRSSSRDSSRRRPRPTRASRRLTTTSVHPYTASGLGDIGALPGPVLGGATHLHAGRGRRRGLQAARARRRASTPRSPTRRCCDSRSRQRLPPPRRRWPTAMR